jgi:O-antigen/teichoic acid export membrane protein
VGAAPEVFFSYQLLVATIDFLLVSRKAYRLMPATPDHVKLWFQFRSMRRVFHFSAIVAVTGALWTVVTQTDKILLSRILSLSDFGIFSLVTVVAGGIATLSQPLRSALLPRLTDLSARQQSTQLISLYRNATQFVTIIACSAALFLALFPKVVLWVWTGNKHIADEAATTLTLYALGNGILVLGAFPYYIQYARGQLSLHLTGTVLYLCILVPAVVLLALRFGTVGAGSAWLGTNALFLLCWVPYLHRRFMGRFHLSWLTRDVGVVCVVTACTGLAIRTVAVWPASRLGAGMLLCAIGLLLVLVAAASSSFARGAVAAAWTQFRSGRHTPGVVP